MATVISELERAFGILNLHLFSGKLRKPEFMLLPKKKLIFQFMPETYRVIIGIDLIKVDTHALLAHLLHEMVHISNYTAGIVDCRSNQYHNKEFMAVAVKVGLICQRHPNHGWVTSINAEEGVFPTKDVINRRNKAFAEINFEKIVFRKAKTEFSSVKAKRIYFLKYECNCPSPHNSIRSGRRPDGDYPLNIKCVDCGNLFVCVEES